MTLAPDAPQVDAVPVPTDAVPSEPVPTEQDERDEAADRAARPVTRTGRRARAPQPPRLSPARAVAGAAVSVAGVLLGIGTLLWISDDPTQGSGPVVQAPPAAVGASDSSDAFATEPEAEQVPVDPPPVVVASAEAPAPAVAAPAPTLVPVTVLNNSRYAGLADRAAAQFRSAGWPVAATGNFRGRIPSTTVYYEAGQLAVAQEFARRFDSVVRVRPRFDTLPARGLVVVVTRDFVS